MSLSRLALGVFVGSTLWALLLNRFAISLAHRSNLLFPAAVTLTGSFGLAWLVVGNVTLPGPRPFIKAPDDWPSILLYALVVGQMIPRPRCRGETLHRFPEPARLVLTGSGILVVTMAVVVAGSSLWLGWHRLAVLAPLPAILGYSLWRHGWVRRLTTLGVDAKGFFVRWESLRNYEWFEEAGAAILRINVKPGKILADGPSDLRLHATGPDPAIDAILTAHGLSPM